MYLVYSLSLLGLLALGLPYLLYRCVRDDGYAASLLARLRAPEVGSHDGPTLWLHAVSVGEVLAAATLVPELRRVVPEARIVCSVITVTGMDVASRRLEGVETIFYCPFDFAFLIRRLVRRLRPRALVVLETEIWPHLLREARRGGAVTMIAGGRISDRSYPRYRLVRGFMRSVLGGVDRFCMQSDEYAERIADLGAPANRVEVTGSLKFDAVATGVAASEFVLPAGRRILMGGSTLEPEEDVLLTAFEHLRAGSAAPDLLLVLAPRHPHRFEAVSDLARRRGLSVVRRSAPAGIETADVVVLDTLGELAALYEKADYVFVGGSLAAWGGHNIIEPAAYGKPVAFGPHMRNFADIAKLFLDEDAAVCVEDAVELEAAIADWIRRPESSRSLGERAARVCAAHRGAAARTATALAELLE